VRLAVFFGAHRVAPSDTAGRVVAIRNLAARVHERGRRGEKPCSSARPNGTRAVTAVQGARDVVIASSVNLTAVLTLLRIALNGRADVAIVCAGRNRQFSLEDAACAGRYAHQLTGHQTSVELNDGAVAA